MEEKIKNILLSHAALVTAIVSLVAPVISQSCKMLWYQPVEPDGLEEFATKHLLKKK